MSKKTVLIVAAFGVVGVMASFSAGAGAAWATKSGLVGIQYGSEDFTNAENLVILGSLDQSWSDADDYGRQWSGKWQGFLVGPVSGVVNLTVETDQRAEVEINSSVVTSAGVTMVKGQKYRLTVSYVKTGGEYDCYLRIKWRWAGQAPTVIGGSSLVYAEDVAAKFSEIVAASDDGDDDDDEDEDDDEDQIEISYESFNLSPSPKVVSGLGKIDLSQAKIVALNNRSKVQASAADMLCDEIDRRTRIGLEVVEEMPSAKVVTIAIGTGKEAGDKVGGPPSGLSVPQKADGYAIWIDKSERGPTICLAGHDDRGALYAVGRLLRMLDMRRDRVSVDAGIQVATAPKYALRGHQMGYRAKTNSYDAWTVAMWEQYLRDMIVFGMSAIEIVPPVTDDLLDSPVMPKKPMDMMIAQSKLADDYGLDVWIWYPAMEFRGMKRKKISPETMEQAIRNRHDVLSKLGRVDAVFVPSGDPGEVHPQYLFPHMKEHKKVLNKYHPKAQMWSSVQNYDDESATMGWTKAFYGWLNSGQVDWFDGVVFGPATEISLGEMRRDVPERFPIRRYPDITHSKSCQYEVDNWDGALEETLGREPINPRPRAFAKIFRDLQEYAIGFISYSEGCNDDLNKVVWSCLGWDPEMKVDDILVEYSRYFISRRFEETFAMGLLGLERNWKGRLKDNDGVFETLKLFQSMERKATPQDKLNWRFQQGLYRAYYDAYVKARQEYEEALETEALGILKTAGEVGSARALDAAEVVLDKAVAYQMNSELRARVFELAEALFQSIGLQTSVPRYRAKQISRGANLDMIDIPFNHRLQLQEAFEEIRKMDSEEQKLAMIARVAANDYEKRGYDWEDIYEERYLKQGLMIDD
ncbi:MAG: hypothetical protein ACYTEL_11670 [Planctomycetota bacterium]